MCTRDKSNCLSSEHPSERLLSHIYYVGSLIQVVRMYVSDSYTTKKLQIAVSAEATTLRMKYARSTALLCHLC